MTSRHYSLPIILYILLILAGCATVKVIPATGPEFLERDGLTYTVNIREDGLRTNPEVDSFEWWYFDASFSDGSTAVIVFFTKAPFDPSGPARPMVSIIITLPDGGKKTAEISSDEFNASKEQCDVRIGSCRVKGDLKDYQLHFEAQNISADLHFKNLAPPWRPGAGKIYYSKDLRHYFAGLPAVHRKSILSLCHILCPAAG